MIGYASNTGTKRNLAALLAADWRILLTPANPTVRDGFSHAIDNGAWSAFQQGTSFQEKPFLRLLESAGERADWVILPDIVAGGRASLDFSLSWIPRLAGLRHLLLPVQDGMTLSDIQPVLLSHPHVGIFMGGSTEWKLAKLHLWGEFATGHDRHFHVGRVNTRRRIRLCHEAGAHSFDGTSATVFSCTLPMLDDARRQPSLLSPTRCTRTEAF